MRRGHFLKRLVYRFVPLEVLGVLALAGAALSPNQASSRSPVANSVLRHALDVELGRAQARPREMPISSGVLYSLLDQTGALAHRAEASRRQGSRIEITGSEGCQNELIGNGQINVRIVQDCSLRAQAQEVLAIDPLDDSKMIAAQDDSRIGFNHCGHDWSFDGGRHWGDQTLPFWEFELLDGHTGDACADPSVTWDSSGNAYVAGVVFNVSTPENAIVVAKS